jgi:hypothetical protein
VDLLNGGENQGQRGGTSVENSTVNSLTRPIFIMMARHFM